MTDLFLTHAQLRNDASAQAMVRVLFPADAGRALDNHHQLVWSLFATDTTDKKTRDFIWRVDGKHFVILSRTLPIESHPLLSTSVKNISVNFPISTILSFRLRANAIVSIKEAANPKKRGNKHDVVMHQTHLIQKENPNYTRAQAREKAIPVATSTWLESIGKRSGFITESINSALYQTRTVPRDHKKRNVNKNASFGILDIDGVLKVTNEELFAENIPLGFGRAKAFGCGLMLLQQLG